MGKKNKAGSGSNSGAGPVDTNLQAVTPSAPVTVLHPLKQHLGSLATNGNGNGSNPDDAAAAMKAIHASAEAAPAASAIIQPAAPAIIKPRPEPAPERLDPTEKELDDFSPENMKAAEDCTDEDMGLTGALSLIKVKRPQAKVYFQCYPDPAFYMNVRLIKNDIEGVGDGKFYLVPPRMAEHPALVDHWRWYTLFPIITRQGVFQLWPVGNRDEDGAMNDACMSARKALAAARTKWVRCWWTSSANMWKEMPGDKAANIPAPIYPYNDIRTPQEVARIALGDYTISDNDHLIIKYLDGRA